MGCRTRAHSSSLLRVVAGSGEVVPDPSGTLPGRGAWVHPTSACVDKAIARKAFGRALRVAGQLDTGRLTETVEASFEASQRNG
ncbi:MAG TPA: YlxR family protein [Galbitalea sp.]